MPQAPEQPSIQVFTAKTASYLYALVKDRTDLRPSIKNGLFEQSTHTRRSVYITTFKDDRAILADIVADEWMNDGEIQKLLGPYQDSAKHLYTVVAKIHQRALGEIAASHPPQITSTNLAMLTCSPGLSVERFDKSYDQYSKHFLYGLAGLAPGNRRQDFVFALELDEDEKRHLNNAEQQLSKQLVNVHNALERFANKTHGFHTDGSQVRLANEATPRSGFADSTLELDVVQALCRRERERAGKAVLSKAMHTTQDLELLKALEEYRTSNKAAAIGGHPSGVPAGNTGRGTRNGR